MNRKSSYSVRVCASSPGLNSSLYDQVRLEMGGGGESVILARWSGDVWKSVWRRLSTCFPCGPTVGNHVCPLRHQPTVKGCPSIVDVESPEFSLELCFDRLYNPNGVFVRRGEERVASLSRVEGMVFVQSFVFWAP